VDNTRLVHRDSHADRRRQLFIHCAFVSTTLNICSQIEARLSVISSAKEHDEAAQSHSRDNVRVLANEDGTGETKGEYTPEEIVVS
jgi:hypothetical protein